MPELNLDGYTDLPPGHIAAIVTYLEMTSPPSCPAGDPPPGYALERQSPPDPARYRQLFRAVGQDWLWFSRLALDEAQLGAALARPGVSVWFLTARGAPAGLLETDASGWPDVEIVFLGLVPEHTGRGAGTWLLRKALDLAWAPGPSRVWLHTCTLDHPSALPLYLKHGFRPFRRAIEAAPDPRISGLLPRHAAPGVPIL